MEIKVPLRQLKPLLLFVNENSNLLSFQFDKNKTYTIVCTAEKGIDKNKQTIYFGWSRKVRLANFSRKHCS